jgi:hypothetical protein
MKPITDYPLLLRLQDVMALLELDKAKVHRLALPHVQFWPGSRFRWFRSGIASILGVPLVLPPLPALVNAATFMDLAGLTTHQAGWCRDEGILWTHRRGLYYRYHLELIAAGIWWDQLNRMPRFSSLFPVYAHPMRVDEITGPSER